MSEHDDIEAMRQTRPLRAPLTLDQFLAALIAIRAARGGDLPVRMADEEPVSHPAVVDLVDGPCVILTHR
jgi:hypothetical protein